MKKMAIFLCLIALAVIGQAQAPAHLTGPAAKNYKSWQKQSSQADRLILVTVNKPPLTGPAAKNRPLPQRTNQQDLQVVSTKKSSPKVMGPLYKNRRSVLNADG